MFVCTDNDTAMQQLKNGHLCIPKRHNDMCIRTKAMKMLRKPQNTWQSECKAACVRQGHVGAYACALGGGRGSSRAAGRGRAVLSGGAHVSAPSHILARGGRQYGGATLPGAVEIRRALATGHGTMHVTPIGTKDAQQDPSAGVGLFHFIQPAGFLLGLLVR